MQQTSPPYAKPAFPFGVLYASAALVLIDQASEFLTGLAPYRWSSVDWRFGAFGLALGRTTSLVLVDVLVVIAAAARADRRLLRVVAVLHGVLAVTVLVGLALFGLDFLELKRLVSPEKLPAVYYASARAALVAVLLASYSVAVAVGLFRATRLRGSRTDDGPLLVTGRGRHA